MAAARRAARVTAVLAVALAVLAAPAFAQQGDVDITTQKIDDSSAFPTARPKLYDFRTIDQATVTGCPDEGATTGSGVGDSVQVVITHNRPINVTVDMLSWLLVKGLRLSSVDSRDNQTYSNYLRMHPRDHISHGATDAKTGQPKTTVPITSKDQLTWVEFPATGCSRTPVEYTCPKGPATANPGWLQGQTGWEKLDQTNSKSVLAKLPKLSTAWVAGTSTKTTPSASASFYYTGCRNITSGSKTKLSCYTPVITTTHSWAATPGGISLTTQLTIGVAKAAGAAVDANDNRIVKNWPNGQSLHKKCMRAAIHLIEEYSALEFWLWEAFAQGRNS